MFHSDCRLRGLVLDPRSDVYGVDDDAEDVRRNKAELRGPQPDDAHNDAVYAGNSEAGPRFLSDKNG